MKKYPKRIGLRIDNETYENISLWAQEMDVSVSWVARQALKYGVDAVMLNLKKPWQIKYRQLLEAREKETSRWNHTKML